MPVTLTIKGVPDAVADALRQRAQVNHRSLQRELLLIAEEAAGHGMRVAEPAPPAYVAPSRKARAAAKKTTERLSLEQLWDHARKPGAGHPAESAAIVRACARADLLERLRKQPLARTRSWTRGELYEDEK